jgi:hypothetical protein
MNPAPTIPPTPMFEHQLEQTLRDQVERRARQQRRRQRTGRIALAGVAAAALVGALILASMGSQPDRTGSDGNNVTTQTTPRTSPATSSQTTTSADTSATTQTTDTTNTTASSGASDATGSLSSAQVRGGPRGAPPCAPPGDLRGGDGTDHQTTVNNPQLAPLRASSTYPGGVRWAVCGAGTEGSFELFNLRSHDNGATWKVIDTGISLVAFHAGDDVTVTFTSARTGEMRVVSLVGERDDHYQTTNGGHTWHCASGTGPAPCTTN